MKFAIVLLVGAGCMTEASTSSTVSEVSSEGKRLFDKETFGGNGRTCQTCHSNSNGTLTLAQIAERFTENPSDELFRGDGTDDGAGNGTSRIRADGTILVEKTLPDGVIVLDDPLSRSVTLRRGIPSTMNTPALDDVFMYDGRFTDLVEQARGAIHDHAVNTVEPSEAQLEAIAEFQRTDARFFSNPALASFAATGIPPVLPEGNTESERRGRRFFDNVPLSPPSTRGICAICHSGPMLNTSNGFNPIPVPPFFVPAGERFQSILSGELLPNGDPFRAYEFTNPDGVREVAVTSDPGRAAVTGDFRGFPFGHLGQFKIPTLWNVKHTSPYFHNSGAKTLDDVLNHYQFFFILATPIAIPGAPPIVMTEQDKADLKAFLSLL